MNYYHVDVFSPQPLSGNSVTVFLDNELSLDSSTLSRITREMSHFESIFLSPGQELRSHCARVFDLFNELPFAGHPVMGAGCVLHLLYGKKIDERWSIQLPAKKVEVLTSRRPDHYYAQLNQGRPEFLGEIAAQSLERILGAVSLRQGDLYPGLWPAIVSTGLRYLIVPLWRNLHRARIIVGNFEQLLSSVGAQFAYLLQIGETSLEGRHWNNDGVIEDVATGSGAGCVAAYLVRSGRYQRGERFLLNQGRFLGRPSRMWLCVEEANSTEQVIVGGEVSIIGRGHLSALGGANGNEYLGAHSRREIYPYRM